MHPFGQAKRENRMNTQSQLQTREHAIHAALQQAIDGWNTGDGHAYGLAFEEDAGYVTFGGMHVQGRSAIDMSHQQLFDTVLCGSRLKLRVTSLRYLSDKIALVHAIGGILDKPDQIEVSPERQSMQTAVLREHDGMWLITSMQVTRVQPVQPGVNVPRG
jgi:uncharacterized protein (TIGR02246 family)